MPRYGVDGFSDDFESSRLALSSSGYVPHGVVSLQETAVFVINGLKPSVVVPRLEDGSLRQELRWVRSKSGVSHWGVQTLVHSSFTR